MPLKNEPTSSSSNKEKLTGFNGEGSIILRKLKMMGIFLSVIALTSCAESENSTPPDKNYNSEEGRKERAAELGLPKDASWKDMRIYNSEERRKEMAAELGLPKDASWKDINIYNSEESRKERAAELGLPKDASWKDINIYNFEEGRKERAAKLGLPEDASWKDINTAEEF